MDPQGIPIGFAFSPNKNSQPPGAGRLRYVARRSSKRIPRLRNTAARPALSLAYFICRLWIADANQRIAKTFVCATKFKLQKMPFNRLALRAFSSHYLSQNLFRITQPFLRNEDYYEKLYFRLRTGFYG